MKMVGAGKGSQPRPSLVSIAEKNLRWELWQMTTTSGRKKEIKKLLKEIASED